MRSAPLVLMSPDWDQSAESAFSHDRDHGQRAWASCSPLGRSWLAMRSQCLHSHPVRSLSLAGLLRSIVCLSQVCADGFPELPHHRLVEGNL